MAERGEEEQDTDKDNEISWRIDTHYEELVKCINIEQLHPHLRKSNLVRSPGVNEFLHNPLISKRDKVVQILNCLESEGSDSYVKFLRCLEEEREHMGHGYLAVLLSGGEYGEREELERSARLEEQIRLHRPDMKDIDLPSLAGVMFSKELLTRDEHEEITSPPVRRTQRISWLLDVVLVSKGPLAHGIFVNCLGREETQPVHRELYCKITGEELDLPPPAKRRKLTTDSITESDSGHLVARNAFTYISPEPPKPPIYLDMQMPLKGKWYDDCIKKYQTFQHNGQWKELEDLTSKLMASADPQIRAMALLEQAIAFIFRNQPDMVKSCISDARALVKALPMNCDNSPFLEARCNHVLSCCHKYAKEYDQAKELIDKAKVLMFMCKPGEDHAWVNYCEASIRLAQLQGSTDTWSPRELRHLQELYRLAIRCTRNHTTGTDVVEQHSHIRLAQLTMSDQPTSSQHQVEKLQTARNSLREVKEDTLTRRTKSLYFIAMSDLHKLDGNTATALGFARDARRIAEQDNYSVELRLAENKIGDLETQHNS